MILGATVKRIGPTAQYVLTLDAATEDRCIQSVQLRVRQVESTSRPAMTLRQKRRRLTQWLRSIFSGRRATEANKRRISIEPLEQRQLLASDAFMALLGSSFENRIEETSPAPFVAQTRSS